MTQSDHLVETHFSKSVSGSTSPLASLNQEGAVCLSYQSFNKVAQLPQGLLGPSHFHQCEC